jgi:hypothetical protein
LFWKKKNHSQSKDPLHLDYEQDRRRYYRVQPGTETPVVFIYENRTEPLSNLGAGGLAFFSTAGLEANQVLKGQLYLPDAVTPMSLSCEVVEVEVTGLVRARITSISPENRELIHQYVLDRQKEVLTGPEGSEPEPGEQV